MAVAALIALVAWILSCSSAHAEVEMPQPDENQSILFGADQANRWNQGAYEVWILHGHCFLSQGLTTTRSDDAVLWVRRGGEFGNRQNLVITYLQGNVKIDYQRAGFPYQLTDSSWLGEFYSISPIEVRVQNPQPEPAVKPEVYRNALAKRDPFANRQIHRSQFAQNDGAAVQPGVVPPGTRRLRAFPRSAVKVQAQWFPNPAGDEWVAVITTGVNLIIDGLQSGTGSLDISTDRMVIWTKASAQPDLDGQTLQSDDTPLEIYMEGNVVFRQGERVIHAERMYYDANNSVGTVLNVDMLTPVPSYRGLLRLRADLVQQTGPDRFFAHNTTITSSRAENPGYRLQTRDVYFEDIQKPVVNPITGEPQINPETGEPLVSHQQMATSKNDFLFLGPVPVFYWPVLATDLSQPSYYIRRFIYKQDQIFGTQILTGFDGFQLLGMTQRPQGLDWTVNLDYFSLRGPGGGSTVTFNRKQFLGLKGQLTGFLDGLYVHDTGLDRLGSNRYNIEPPTENRYRILGRSRQFLPENWRITTEVGKISDVDFLEQYYTQEWYATKDQTTGIDVKRLSENQSYGINFDVRLNSFLTQTENYPRLDHYLLGQSLLNDKLTYFEHTTGSYSSMQVYSLPASEQSLLIQNPLPWEVNGSRTGAVVNTTHEVDLPIDVGPGKIVPYALGQFAYWGQDIAGNSVSRVFGVGGVRGSIPFWTANPNIESSLLNVHGIAHKVVLEGDLSFQEANQSMTTLAQYNPLQDDAQEYFQRRFATETFGGTTPLQFDDRFYALRTGLANSVTNPTPEIADTLTAFRFGANQRWQTKRGPANRRRIIDWITLDTNAVFFPDANRDNFGEAIGLATYNFRWHIGDRLTLVSNGMYDFFSQGEKITTVGLQLSRPPRGTLFVGFNALHGPAVPGVLDPFKSNMLTTSYSYRMSPKWVSMASASFDIAGLGMVGNQVTMTRVGESFLTSLSFSYNKYLSNFSFGYMLEPRFLARTRSGSIGGAQVPLAGANGLE